ncbi:conserved hypothetical protein [Leishmania mexicana MHOM/GT/2001/U1103]|uniref:Uncharacterized protein n=1 Tax=Leishmania mexicana (strain MHOM/GT/2001/U1103) TaxID=929439 RepID=E9B5T3_LEIMU|nr:conserved hypothetical protein [Leishmania mexicana MHOM/GT/2001/U1103]CBZ30604.1 conserved hypothetical protein [Leishmania mexicana MHOM/GT/2001/U1103]
MEIGCMVVHLRRRWQRGRKAQTRGEGAAVDAMCQAQTMLCPNRTCTAPSKGRQWRISASTSAPDALCALLSVTPWKGRGYGTTAACSSTAVTYHWHHPSCGMQHSSADNDHFLLPSPPPSVSGLSLLPLKRPSHLVCPRCPLSFTSIHTHPHIYMYIFTSTSRNYTPAVARNSIQYSEQRRQSSNRVFLLQT